MAHYGTHMDSNITGALVMGLLHAQGVLLRALFCALRDGAQEHALPGGGFVSVGADSGLEMDLHTRFPGWMLRAHSFGACALVALTLAQKEVVRRMAAEAAGAVTLHRRLGYAALTALVIMDVAGYALVAFLRFRHVCGAGLRRSRLNRVLSK